MKKTINASIPFLIGIGLFFYLIIPGSFINIVPYEIHEHFFHGDGYEKAFIIGFDFLLALAAAFTIRWMRSTK